MLNCPCVTDENTKLPPHTVNKAIQRELPQNESGEGRKAEVSGGIFWRAEVWQRSAEISSCVGHRWHKWDCNSQESEAERDRQPLVQSPAQNKANFNIREVVQGLALVLGQNCSWLAFVGVQRRNPSAASML